MSSKLKVVFSIILFGLTLIYPHKTVSTKDVGGDKLAENDKLQWLNEQRKIKEQQELLRKQQEEAERLSRRSETNALYNPNNLREISKANPQLLYNMMSNTAYQSQEMVDLLIQCEESDKPINAVFLLSLMKSESKSGYSALSRANNNVASIKTSNGWKSFDSFEGCLKYLINLLNGYYLDENAMYYKGTDIWSINTEYCPNDDYYWSKLINQVASEYDCVITES